MDVQTIEANRRQQAELYGRPLGDIVRDLTGALRLTQARLAETLGMSAPMLSQLASAQRVKIGNPQAVARLQGLLDLAPQAPAMAPDALDAAVAEVASRATTITQAPASPGVTGELRAVASPEALLAAARAAEPLSPGLAALLRRAAGVEASRG